MGWFSFLIFGSKIGVGPHLVFVDIESFDFFLFINPNADGSLEGEEYQPGATKTKGTYCSDSNELGKQLV